MTFKEEITQGNCAHVYTITRTWTATDECGNKATHIQAIHVQDDVAPVFMSELPKDVKVECDNIPQPPVITAVDGLGNPVTVEYEEVKIAGTCPNNYILKRTWTAKDACSVQTSHTQTITVNDNTKPSFVENLPQNITVSCEAVPTAPILTATDNCGAATVSYNETRANGTCANSYTLTRVWTAKDACNNETTHTQTVTVEDKTAPIFEGNLPVDTTVECSAIPEPSIVEAIDNCGHPTIIYKEQIVAGSCAGSYTLTRTWTATDDCGNSTTHTQIVTVEDKTAPIFEGNLPEDVTVSCDAVPEAAILNASDNCGEATVVFKENKTEGQCSNNFALTRIWIATDNCGNITTYTQIITVQDTTHPLILKIPEDITVSCSGLIPVADIKNITTSDNCGDEVTIQVSDNITEQKCDNKYTIIRTWVATDACGNSTTSSQTITVNDSIPPTFIGELPKDQLVCEVLPNPAILGAKDNCGDAFVSFEESMDSLSSAPNYIIVKRTWIASDICNNTTTHTQVIALSLPIRNLLYQEICEGESVTVGEHQYTKTGIYIDTLKAENTCDSIVTLDLLVHPKKYTTIDTTICSGTSIVIGQYTYSSNISNETIVLSQVGLGCDSVITLTLRVIPCDTIIYDSLPVMTSDTICGLKIPEGENVIIKSCETGHTSGTGNFGTWTIDEKTQCLIYTAGSYTGVDTLSICACDTVTTLCYNNIIIITVTGLPPIAADDCYEDVHQNEEIRINVLENDKDPDHDPLFVSAVISPPKYGIASVAQDGQSILYIPNKNFCGRDTLYYEVCDGQDGCDTAMVCLHVNCECVFPQVITPNNDGFNDYLFFPCLSTVTGAKLIVWHRWGLVVYQSDDYQNDWQGNFKGQLLPAGTYWYSLDYVDPETGKNIHEVNYFMIVN